MPLSNRDVSIFVAGAGVATMVAMAWFLPAKSNCYRYKSQQTGAQDSNQHSQDQREKSKSHSQNKKGKGRNGASRKTKRSKNQSAAAGFVRRLKPPSHRRKDGLLQYARNVHSQVRFLPHNV